MGNDELRKVITTKMANGEYELKPCPFCGRRPTLASKEFFDGLQESSKDGGACITIRCMNCSLDFRDHTYDEHDYYIRAFLVTEKWNRRIKQC